MKVAAGDILAQQDNVSSVSTTPRIMDSDICFGLRIIWLSPLLSLSPVSSIL